MAVKLFKPSVFREEAIQALREGMTPVECAAKFHVSERTAWRWLKEMREGPRPTALPQIKKEANRAVRITVEMGSRDLFKLLAILLRGS